MASNFPAGHASTVIAGQLPGGSPLHWSPFPVQSNGLNNTLRLYALSPVFVIAPETNADGSYNVVSGSAIVPSGVNVGDRFRLIFLTDARNATPSDIATYNTFAQHQAGADDARRRHQPYAHQFKIVGSTSQANSAR